jgi:hypothetical protein
MENWAIVIGINQYWTPRANLNGAVRDAEDMCDWLLRTDGGGVPAHNLYLLLKPDPLSPPPQVRSLTATRDNIVTVIEELIQRSGGHGNRLFFYFSGHGLSTVKDYTLYNGLVPADFTDILTAKAISLRSIYDRFLATRFNEQFFFIDACRNIPFERPFRISDLDQPGEPAPPFPPQFVMYATSTGLKAAELGFAGNEQGAFTHALLDGLSGAGSAKVFDDESQEYLVTWENLFRYVQAQVRQRKIGVGGSLIQEPKKAGEHGDESPILGRFNQGSFGKETLNVNLIPGEAVPTAEVVVGHLGGEVERRSAPASLPIQFSLEPRTYSLRWLAQQYAPTKPYERVDLYGPRSVNLQLLPVPTAGFPAPVFNPQEDFTRGLGGESTRVHLRSTP